MIEFEKFKLNNGLEVVLHQDKTSSLVCLNTLYKVGSKNEDPNKTGFAHLFEHLMFGGSKHIPNFDSPLQAVGGDNNAFTSSDITNYYTTVPANNIETGFWLESDRMLALSFEEQVLEREKNVVVEEFKQRYLNQPYGDVWLKLSPATYQLHPYRWPTIGKEISHIENINMEEVKAFFNTYYAPSNAILVIAGNINLLEAQRLCAKWFAPIEDRSVNKRVIPLEPKQTQGRHIDLTAQVPQNAIYKAYHMPGRVSKQYQANDLLSDILGRGKSSLLHQRGVKKSQVFSSLSSYVTGSIDPGLMIISGRLSEKITFETAEKTLDDAFQELKTQPTESLQKVKNMAASSITFGEIDLLNRAMSLAYSTHLGNTDLVNKEIDIVEAVTEEEISAAIHSTLLESNCTTLYYHKN
jgi:zinc protease